MDTFMDQLSEKVTAQDMIQANTTAELESYKGFAEQMKVSADKVQEASERLQAVAEQLKAGTGGSSAVDEDVIFIVEEEISDLGKSIGEVKERVTAMQASLAGNADGFRAMQESLAGNADGLRALQEGIAANEAGIRSLKESISGNEAGIRSLQEKLENIGSVSAPTPETQEVQKADVSEMTAQMQNGLADV